MSTLFKHLDPTGKQPSLSIVVCSKSAIKVSAVSDAIERLGWTRDIESDEAASWVPDQPFGDSETLRGAFNRAAAIASRHRGAYVVAIENGIVERPGGYFDLAYVVVVDPDGHITVRCSKSIPVPAELVEESRKSGWTVTAGKLEAARSGCDHADPHVVWSGNTTNRKAILADVIGDAMHVSFNHYQPGEQTT